MSVTVCIFVVGFCVGCESVWSICCSYKAAAMPWQQARPQRQLGNFGLTVTKTPGSCWCCCRSSGPMQVGLGWLFVVTLICYLVSIFLHLDLEWKKNQIKDGAKIKPLSCWNINTLSPFSFQSQKITKTISTWTTSFGPRITPPPPPGKVEQKPHMTYISQ